MLANNTLALAAIFISSLGFAQKYRTPMYKDIRWLGRGNTGVALVSDGSAAFYNPGGLGKSDSYEFRVINPSLGANRNIYDSALAFMGSSQASISDYMEPFMGIPLAANANYFPYLKFPNFMVGYFISNSQVLLLQNPVTPELDIDYRYDRGVIIGGGGSIANRVFWGGSFRYQKRSMIKDVLGGSTITNLSLEALLNNLTLGEGLGLNLGAQYKHELTADQALHFGVAVEDVGSTTFVSQDIQQGAPLVQSMMVAAGFAYAGQLPGLSYAFLVDVNRLNLTDESYTKKIQIGGEISIPAVTVRGGFYQGYWAAGLSTDLLPFLTLDLASYAEELGVAGGQNSNRYYMLGLQIGMELNHKKKQKKQKYTLDHL